MLWIVIKWCSFRDPSPVSLKTSTFVLSFLSLLPLHYHCLPLSLLCTFLLYLCLFIAPYSPNILMASFSLIFIVNCRESVSIRSNFRASAMIGLLFLSQVMSRIISNLVDQLHLGTHLYVPCVNSMEWYDTKYGLWDCTGHVQVPCISFIHVREA